MCARFVQAGSSLFTGPFTVLVEMWGGGRQPARYNIAPTQEVPVVRLKENGDGYRADALRWGLVPGWAKDASIGTRLINARSETAAEKPAFKSAFERRRCVVPASGFVEWKSVGREKEPHYIFRADGELMLFAGLWERWRPRAEGAALDSTGDGSSPRDSGKSLETFTVLTCPPNAFMEQLHDRMPVVLHAENALEWLSPGGARQELLRPIEDEALDSYAVSRRINNVRNDDAACLKRVEQPGLFD